MSLGNGHHYIAIPGPTVIPERVLGAMHRASPNIFSKEFGEIMDSLVPDLKKIAHTKHCVALYASNGHGGWEASLANVISPGEHVLALCNGRFGLAWAHYAEKMRAKVKRLDFGLHAPVDPKQVEAVLMRDDKKQIKAIMIVFVDTSTAIKNDILEIRKVLDRVGHPALLIVDAIAAFGSDPFYMDDWGVDVMVAASQKGLMSPAGLGFVFFNEKAAEEREKIQNISPYWDWKPRVRIAQFSERFCGTPPTHIIFALREALDMVGEEGIEKIWKRHEILARAIWAAIDVWGKAAIVKMNMQNYDAHFRAYGVTVVSLGVPYGTKLREWMTDNIGVTLGIDIVMAGTDVAKKDGFFRIGHMGHVNAHMVLGLLSGVEAGLRSLELPLGDGALEAAASEIAKGHMILKRM